MATAVNTADTIRIWSPLFGGSTLLATQSVIDGYRKAAYSVVTVLIMRAIPEVGIERLMFFIQHRLAQLQWTRDDLAGAGGPSPSTLYKAHRAGRELAERTLARLELALGWQPGSAQQIINGGSPTLRLSERVQTVTARIDAALADGEDKGVRHTAAELRDLLMAVADRLDDFYTGQPRAATRIADVGVS